MSTASDLRVLPYRLARRAHRVIVALALALLLLLPRGAASQAALFFVDEAGALDRARVEAAVGPLRARGALVAVVVVASGDDNGEDFARRLDAAGLLARDAIVSDGIAIYVSMTPRYSQLRVGSCWSSALPNSTLAAIRQSTLNPSLQAGDFTGAVTATLQALDAGIVAGPPSILSRLNVPLLGGGAAAIAAILAVIFVLRRRHLNREADAILAENRERRYRELVTLADSCRAALANAGAAGANELRLAEFQQRLRKLDERRVSLEERQPEGYAFSSQAYQLRTDYESLARSIRSSLAPVADESSPTSPTDPAPSQPSGSPRDQVVALATQAHAAVKKARQEGKPPQVCANLQEELQRLDRERKRLWRKPQRAQDRAAQQRELEQLVARYERLIQRADTTPRHRREPLRSSFVPDFLARNTEPERDATSYGSSGSSSSSSDHNWSSDWSSGSPSSSSGESSDGGSW